MRYLILYLLAFLSQSCCLLQATNGTSIIGAIFDQTSRPGKEAKVAIEIAIHDFNIKFTNQTSILYLQNSRNKPGQAAFAGEIKLKFCFEI